MSTDTSAPPIGTTVHELRHRTLASGDALAAVFRRTYDAPIDDVWDACTDPERLRRWYQPVEGDLRLGGRFTQGMFAPGEVVRCEAPRLLAISLADGVDEITLRLAPGPDDTTVFELEHATTLDTHEIGGTIFDAVYCMGGGYGPRLETLDAHLHAALPADVDAGALHLREDMHPAIESSMAALADLLVAEGRRPVRGQAGDA
jgi:uncharacterized protein YndB with AHSA1/START domain